MLPTEEGVDNPQSELIRCLSEGGYVDTMDSYFCPSEKRDEFVKSQERFDTGEINYFYYSFTDRPTGRYLSNFLRKNVQWPRVLKDTMHPDTWVLSDSWFSNMPTSHKYYKKGVNYATLGGSVDMIKDSPRDSFR